MLDIFNQICVFVYLGGLFKITDAFYACKDIIEKKYTDID